ncbi:MAG: hypothetical protein QG573_2168 [Acidobacteriota bacterium]|nr:hypothetical protein [Acidobacteriota bacterium]
MRPKPSIWLCAAILVAAQGAAAQVPYLIRDLNPPHESVPGSRPQRFVSLGARALFIATTDLAPYELWSSDGTSAGTQAIRFPCAIYCDTAPPGVNSVLGVQDGIAFLAVGEFDPASYEVRDHLWRTDGTQAGTLRLTAPGSIDYLFPDGAITTPVFLDGRLFFAHRREETGPLELWATDGTEDGTAFVAALDVGASATPAAIVAVGSELFVLLRKFDPVYHLALWKSDGTEAGTVEIEIFLGSFQSVEAAIPAEAVLFFSARTPIEGSPDTFSDQLWVTDGRPGGTRKLTAFPAYTSLPHTKLRLDEGRLHFYIEDSVSILQVWQSDGTVDGTFPLSAFSSEQMCCVRTEPPPIAELHGSTYFVGIGADEALALWRSEDFPGGATRVARLDRPNFDGDSEMVWLERFGDLLVFPAHGDHGWEIYTSDGTRSGTHELADLCTGECDGRPSRPLVLGDRIFFEAMDPQSNRQLWTSALPDLEPRQLTFPPARAGDSPVFAAPEVARLSTGWLFAATDATHGFELWRSGGTPETTEMVIDLLNDRPGLLLAGVESDGGELFFSASAENRELYEVIATDATAAGTSVLSEAPSLRCGLFSWNSAPALYALPTALLIEEDECDVNRILSWNRGSGELTTLFGGREPPNAGYAAVRLRHRAEALVERVDESSGETQLWRTDGTWDGTRYLRPMPEPLQISSIQLAVQGKALYSPSWPSPSLRALDLATYEDSEVTAFVSPSTPDYRIHPAGELGYFFVRRAGYFDEVGAPLELWRTTGSTPGTFLVAGLVGGYRWAGEIVDLGGSAVFLVATLDGTTELWRSDGTLPGTGVIASFATPSSSGLGLDRLGGYVFFQGRDEAHGEELWRTDGTAAGTALLLDLTPGPAGSVLPWSAAGERYLYFTAGQVDPLPALWVSDGTTQGTRLIVSAWDSGPASPFALGTPDGGERLYFSAESPEAGFELWQVDASSGVVRRVADLWPGPASSFPQDFMALGDVLLFTADDGVHGRELWALPPAGTPCVASGTRACLLGDRFAAELVWKDGTAAPARALTDRTAAFSRPGGERFDALIKIVDGTAVNGHHWLFGADLVAEGFELRVTDSANGAVQEIADPPGHLASFGEITAFPSFPPPVVVSTGSVRERPGGGGACTPSLARLCLGGGRFAVQARARDFFGLFHDAIASPIDFGAGDSAFWLFDPAAIELVVRLEVAATDGRVALTVASMTNLGYEISVTDLLSGATATVAAPVGLFRSQVTADLFPPLP